MKTYFTASKSTFSLMQCIVCRLYVDKRRLMRFNFLFIVQTSYNSDFYSFMHVNVLKRRFSVSLTAWAGCPKSLVPISFLNISTIYLTLSTFFFQMMEEDVKFLLVPRNFKISLRKYHFSQKYKNEYFSTFV